MKKFNVNGDELYALTELEVVRFQITLKLVSPDTPIEDWICGYIETDDGLIPLFELEQWHIDNLNEVEEIKIMRKRGMSPAQVLDAYQKCKTVH